MLPHDATSGCPARRRWSVWFCRGALSESAPAPCGSSPMCSSRSPPARCRRTCTDHFKELSLMSGSREDPKCAKSTILCCELPNVQMCAQCVWIDIHLNIIIFVLMSATFDFRSGGVMDGTSPKLMRTNQGVCSASLDLYYYDFKFFKKSYPTPDFSFERFCRGK